MAGVGRRVRAAGRRDGAGESSGGGSAGGGVSLSGLVMASTVGGSRLVLMSQECAWWRELLPLLLLEYGREEVLELLGFLALSTYSRGS